MMGQSTDREGHVRRVLLAALALAFGCLIAAAVAAAWVTRRNQAHTAWVNHTYEVELTVAEARRLIEQAETARRGYILTGDERLRAIHREAITGLAMTMRSVSRLTAENPRQRVTLAALNRLLDAFDARHAQSLALVAAGRAPVAGAAFMTELDTQPMQRIRGHFAAMSKEEHRLLAIRDRDQRRSFRIFYFILGIAGVLVVLVAVTTLVVVLRYTRDLAASRNSLQSLNDSLEDQVALRTADLSRANEEIQRFAYIVSHDLRSPLVNVMGFTAELEAASGAMTALIDRAETEAPVIVSDEARLAAREDLPEAIGFIRASTQKMDRLINAILTLSRQGRRVLSPEPIDVAATVESIVATFAHRVEEEGAKIAIDGPLPTVETDRLAFEQILSNLIENALKYRAPDRPARVFVRGGQDAAHVWFEVADNGRGIAPADHQRVFDLFRRSGAQDQPGEGIGLAHVRALAYRLGGRIDLSSVVGAGSTFRLTLPPYLSAFQQDLTK